MPPVRFQLPAGSTTKAAFIAAIKAMAARAIAAERGRQQESPQAGASPAAAATSKSPGSGRPVRRLPSARAWWRSLAGFQSWSEKITVSALVRLMPLLPAMLGRKTVISGEELN